MKPSKGEMTRERIFQIALKSFKQKGFEATTLRWLAEEAEISLGLSYRYFSSKDDIVVEFYRRMTQDFLTQMKQLPREKLAQRFTRAMLAKIEALEGHREVFAALLPKMSQPGSKVSLFGPETAAIREQVLEGFELIVDGASNCPREEELAHDLARLLFLSHFAILLFWLHDRSKGFAVTKEILGLIEKAVGWMQWALMIPANRRMFHSTMDLFFNLFDEGKSA